MSKIRVLLVDDHALFREALRLLLEMQPDIEVMGEAADGLKVTDLVSELKPTVVLMDINMPVMDGIQATRLVKKKHPTVGIIVLTMYPQDVHVLEALKAGAKAYLLKDTSSEELLHVIRSVHQGQAVVDPDVTSSLLDELHRLDSVDNTDPAEQLIIQDIKVLTLIANGFTTSDIARELQLSERGVKTRVAAIMKKLGAANRAEAVLRAMRAGIIK